MLEFKVYLDRHDIDDDLPEAGVCKAAFAAYHEAEMYAKLLAAAWLDRTEPVLVRVTGPGGNRRYFPLRTTTEGYWKGDLPEQEG